METPNFKVEIQAMRDDEIIAYHYTCPSDMKEQVALELKKRLLNIEAIEKENKERYGKGKDKRSGC